MPKRIYRLPWAVSRLPFWVPWVPGLVFLASAVLKPFKPNYLCGPDPWEAINGLTWPVEIYLAAVLLWWRPRIPVETRRLLELRDWAKHRRIGALLGALFVAGAAALLSFVHFIGPRLFLRAEWHPCGCFGPVELPYGVHMAILGVMLPCLVAVFVHEETRLVETPQAPSDAPATPPPLGVSPPVA